MSMEPSRNLTLFLHRSGSIYHVITDMRGKYTYVNELYKKIFFNSTVDYRQEYFETSIFPEDITLHSHNQFILRYRKLNLRFGRLGMFDNVTNLLLHDPENHQLNISRYH